MDTDRALATHTDMDMIVVVISAVLSHTDVLVKQGVELRPSQYI